jgi:hypothetical protein
VRLVIVDGAATCIDIDMDPDPVIVAALSEWSARRRWLRRVRPALAWIFAAGAGLALAWWAR